MHRIMNVSILPLMKNLLFTLFAVLLLGQARSQYYYHDIINNEQLQKDILSLKDQKIRKVSIMSFEADGSPSEGFFCEKKISKDYGKTELFTRSDISKASMLTSYFDNMGRVIKITDSSNLSVAYTDYLYNASGKVINIISRVISSDDDFHSEMKEEHLYFYDDQGNPSEMKKVKNGKDTTLILFKTDENGNIAIEKDTRTGSKYYYYYNDRHLLTDVVLSNEYKEKLTPQYSFDYNNQGRLTTMRTNSEGGGHYYVWKYAYEDGLRSIEKCYSKGQYLLGSVEYSYQR